MLTNTHKQNCLFYYTACFAVSFALLFGSNVLIHQTAPIFIINRLDISLNLLLLTRIGDVVMGTAWLQILLDVAYLLLPMFLLWAVLKQSRYQYALAFVNVVYNIGYTLLLTSLSALSMQWFIGCILIPAIFTVKKEQSFYFSFHCLRYLFIIIFFSAGWWKIRAGGVFNPEQMSAILLRQHGPLLVSDPDHWYASFILKMVAQPHLGYLLYLLGTLAELSFFIGIFTRKWDRLLLIILLLFILLDFLIMKINYFPWVSFGFLFWYSKLKEPLPAGEFQTSSPLKN